MNIPSVCKSRYSLFSAAITTLVLCGCGLNVSPLGNSDAGGYASFKFKGRVTDCATGKGLANILISSEIVNDGILFGFRDAAGGAVTNSDGYFEFTPRTRAGYKFYAFTFSSLDNYYNDDYFSLSNEEIAKSHGKDVDLSQRYAPLAYARITYTNKNVADSNDLIVFSFETAQRCGYYRPGIRFEIPKGVYDGNTYGYRGAIRNGTFQLIAPGGDVARIGYVVRRRGAIADSGSFDLPVRPADTVFYHLDY